ncbi:MAG: TetR/AcrR family transcriptional regulator [Burkholderiaceae bacterium]
MPGAASDTDTRARLLDAALVLFRQRGFHGVGVAEILSRARAPKGSLYHHFPGGKTALAVVVVQSIEHGVRALIEADASASTAGLVRHVGAQCIKWMQRTGGDACALLASFAAEGGTDATLRDAVGAAYGATARLLEARLRRDGCTRAQARERAALVLILFEGAGLVSHARAEPALFASAVDHAARLCEA